MERAHPQDGGGGEGRMSSWPWLATWAAFSTKISASGLAFIDYAQAQ